MTYIVQLPKTQHTILSVPEPHVLLITINRPKQLNALNPAANWELHHLINWAEEEESIWCLVITGVGDKAFCTGMDLVNAHQERESDPNNSLGESTLPPSGFGGISNRRRSRKPIIAAVNGYALGGGMEMVVACNIVVASEHAQFGLPEVRRGVVIAAGGLARLARSVSYQVASELVLTGRFLKAQEAKQLGLVNEVVPGKEPKDVVDVALSYAKQITANSPDAVFLTKQGLLLALERASMTDATEEWMRSPEADAWRLGDNLSEGLMAFAQRRKPRWKSVTTATRSHDKTEKFAAVFECKCWFSSSVRSVL
ncbi:ClpP/crotonase-like domain-containing protein [Mycotypha africana]|uniref:ClpP/crotonase-like domain-containing protein n=1 Tax=Mycotypha africana TaxID=64632 RepID=UPI0023018232|nr:ClpP/crotonase-like domain-containing protein [Mycotypha africana]KAI8982055.1 ClpP/crotonase-like domain-containing protein [Mycotypha africana]